MAYIIYLAGEIHTDWRTNLEQKCADRELPVTFTAPVTNHQASDDCGVHILGEESSAFWKDRKGAGINAIRTRSLIEKADLVVVRFGSKYRQWNAAFDAGYAHAKGKPLVILHDEEHDHALKEIDAAAQAVARTLDEVADVIQYVLFGKLG